MQIRDVNYLLRDCFRLMKECAALRHSQQIDDDTKLLCLIISYQNGLDFACEPQLASKYVRILWLGLV